MPRWQGYAIVGLISAIVLLTNLGGPRLWDRDEPRNAGCAAEMLARGDWVVPVFNSELRTHKPVLLYWLMMSAYSLLGVSEFTARLPSAILGIGTALCTFEMARHLFSPRAGVWAGIAVTTSLMFVVAGRAATPDAALIFFSTLAVTIFALGIPIQSGSALGETKSPESFSIRLAPWRALGVYAAMAFATLAKGPIGFILPTAVIGSFALLRVRNSSSDRARGWQEYCLDVLGKLTPRRIGQACWHLRPLTAAVVILVVAAPWYVWVGVRTDGEFLRGFFLEHNLSRAMNAMEGHRGNVAFYPITLLVGLFPWSVFAVPIILDLVRQYRQPREKAKQSNLGDPADCPRHPGYLLAGCWLAIYIGIFSLAKTKLPSYVTPCYPAAALIIGAFFDRWQAGVLMVSRLWLQAASVVLMLVGIGVSVAIVVATHEKLPGEEWLAFLGVIPLLAGGLAWWAIRRDMTRRATWLVAGTATAFATLLFAVGAERASSHQLNQILLDRIDEFSSSPSIAAYGCLEPSWVFYGGRSIDEITDETVRPTHSPFVERNGRWLPKPPVTIAEVATKSDAFVITTTSGLEAAQKQLPPDFKVLERIPLFLKDDELILLGRMSSVLSHRDKPDKRKL